MNKSEFLVKKLDCPSEENIIRMKLSNLQAIKGLSFDIPQRKLTVFHDGQLPEIIRSIDSLNFNSSLIGSTEVEESVHESVKGQKNLLWKVLIINFTFFLFEILTGLFSHSMGLVADSLDMLADAIVYGLSLFAVGAAIAGKKRVAEISGYFQLLLALAGVFEVIRRFSGYEEVPDYKTMITVSILALMANTACLFLLRKSKSDDAHMKASLIFTSNDVIINLGVVAAGILVFMTDSKYPDLVIGSIVFVIVCKGAFSILKLSK